VGERRSFANGDEAREHRRREGKTFLAERLTNVAGSFRPLQTIAWALLHSETQICGQEEELSRKVQCNVDGDADRQNKPGFSNKRKMNPFS